MRVIFLRTRKTGQEQTGVIVFQSGRLAIDPEVTAAADHLLRNVDRGDAAAVEAALRQAPAKYDGAYLRAAVEG